MRAVVVVPSNRPDRLATFLGAWRDEFEGAEVIVVQDQPEVDLAALDNVTVCAWKDIDHDLGASAWVIPRRTDAVRSYGFLKAWRRNPDMIVSLDDDVLPQQPGFLNEHWKIVGGMASAPAWVSTVEGFVPRGVPYESTNRVNNVALNHGLWAGVPDYDAVTQLAQLREPKPWTGVQQVVPRGSYFPMCGMNVAFRPEFAPAMYFGLQGQTYEYDRFGDIWAGVFAKKIADHLGFAVTSGKPTVLHQRASNVWANLRKEARGMEANETLWAAVDLEVLTSTSIVGCYRQLAGRLMGIAFTDLSMAMLDWCDLFEPELTVATV